MLDGIDIASYQESLVPSRMATTDFIIVKATGGTGYVNPCFKTHANQTVKSGKLLGLYHYAREEGCSGSARAEAAYFATAVKPYLGKAMLALDFEGGAVDLGASWAKEWLDEVYRLTGVKPLLYSYKNCVRALDWSKVTKSYKLWAAQYGSNDPTGYKRNPWTDAYGFGAWKNPTIYQYTSKGRVKGYDGSLDLNLFYGDKADWQKLCKVYGTAAKAVDKVVSAVKPVQKVSKLERMVSAAVSYANDDSHGYSQVRRWPSEGTDFDCASLMYQCAKDAGYNVRTGVGKYTGTMKVDFKNAGFSAIRFTKLSDLRRGDILLNVKDHTEMYIGGGKFVGAHIAETGGVDGQPGDQTGKEISVCDAYVLSSGWDWVLRPHESESEETESQKASYVRYRVSTDPDGKVWLDEMRDHKDTGGSGDDYAGILGTPIRWLAIDAKKYRVFTERSGWLTWVKKYDYTDLDEGCAGDGSPILGIEVADSTICHASHVMRGSGQWYADMVGQKDTGGTSDPFAGDLANRIDGFRAERM